MFILSASEILSTFFLHDLCRLSGSSTTLRLTAGISLGQNKQRVRSQIKSRKTPRSRE